MSDLDRVQDPVGASPTEDARRWGVWRPTWELELLISGAVVFSLFQLPARLQGWFERVANQLSTDAFMGPYMIFYMAYLGVLIFIICFSVHFLLRSFWVALCGMATAFPDGIEWEKVEIGPMMKQTLQELTPSVSSLERRVDRIASSVFSILFYLFITLTVITGWLVVLQVITFSLWRGFFSEAPQLLLFYAVALLFFGPLIWASLLDGRYRKKPEILEARPGQARRVARVLRFYQLLLLGWLTAPMMLTFASHSSQRKVQLASFASITVLVSIFIINLAAAAGRVGFDSYVFLPGQAEGKMVDPERYEDTRSSAIRPGRRPSIQSLVIEDPYVRLFVPFRPDWDNPLVTARCPELRPFHRDGLFLISQEESEGGLAEKQAIECLQSLYEVELDGVRLEVRDGAFYRHPETGSRGLLAMIPVHDLAVGRHQLTIARPAEADEDRSYTILFWI